MGRLLLLSKLTIFLGRCQGAFLSDTKLGIENRKRGEFLGVTDVLGLRRLRKMKWKVVNPSTLRNRMKKLGIVYGKQWHL
ncbi:MAG: hypothetical protein D3917_02115 [Candidatus Electrothrix sp. AX5]|nr:hypothetical protein [Candidatus Electrothrix sp. AX5]